MRCNFELWLFDEFIRHLFWSSEEHPSEDQLVNEKGRSVYVHQPLLLFCGAISHICYCLQTLYFFKVGPVPRVLRIEGVEKNCDQDLDKNALELLKALVRSPIPSRQFSPCIDWSFAGSGFYGRSRKCLQVTWFCSRHFAPFHWQRDGTHSRHRSRFEFLNPYAADLFRQCDRGSFWALPKNSCVCRLPLLGFLKYLQNASGLHPDSDPNTGKKAQTEKDIITLVQKLHPDSHGSKHAPASESPNFCKQCELWRSRSFLIYKKVFALLQECGDSLDLPKPLHWISFYIIKK